MIKNIVLGPQITLEEFIEVARYGAKVEFSEEYAERVEKARKLVDRWVEEGRVMYGITTGFGVLCTETITKEETAKLQRNIILTHSVSVGEPLSVEQTRAVMLMVLQNAGQGYSGIRLEVLDMYRQFLNSGLTPFAPKDGSVGYLNIEAHIALALIGEGKAYIKGELMPAKEALNKIGLKPIELSSKEGLVLVNGTTSPTALGSLALYDMIKAAKTADIIGAMTLEVLKGGIKAFDERIMSIKPHKDQGNTASNVRRLLEDSQIIKYYEGYRLQDALSLRCISQLHGAAFKTLMDAKNAFEIEINSCCDNPIIWTKEDDEQAISNGNCDASYVGIEMDSSCIAATTIAKMSERRNNRLVDGNMSEYPWFLVKKPGLNSGLMIPQYSQAGILNDMRILCHPATIDSISTCGNQEDYVSMGYNACKKGILVAEKLEYILAIELLSVYQAHQFLQEGLEPGTATKTILEEIKSKVPVMEEDMYLYPYIEELKDIIHSGRIIDLVEEKVGKLV